MPVHLQALAESLNREDVTLTLLADGSGVILDLDGQHVLSVNPVGMCVIEALKAGRRSETALVEAVCTAYEVDETRAGEDVRAFIEQASSLLCR